MAAEYHKAATLMSKYSDPVAIAKIDCVANSQAQSENGVNSFPTIRLFHNGGTQDYHHNRRAPDFVSWLRKRVLNPSIEIKNMRDFEKEKVAHHVVVMFFGAKESPEY